MFDRLHWSFLSVEPLLLIETNLLLDKICKSFDLCEMNTISFFLILVFSLCVYCQITQKTASLSQLRLSLAATSVENLAFFGGGYNGVILQLKEHVSLSSGLLCSGGHL